MLQAAIPKVMICSGSQILVAGWASGLCEQVLTASEWAGQYSGKEEGQALQKLSRAKELNRGFVICLLCTVAVPSLNPT